MRWTKIEALNHVVFSCLFLLYRVFLSALFSHTLNLRLDWSGRVVLIQRPLSKRFFSSDGVPRTSGRPCCFLFKAARVSHTPPAANREVSLSSQPQPLHLPYPSPTHPNCLFPFYSPIPVLISLVCVVLFLFHPSWENNGRDLQFQNFHSASALWF
jgi:hypothetical protein